MTTSRPQHKLNPAVLISQPHSPQPRPKKRITAGVAGWAGGRVWWSLVRAPIGAVPFLTICLMVAALSNIEHPSDPSQNPNPTPAPAPDPDDDFTISRTGWWVMVLGFLLPVVSLVLVYTIVRPSIPPAPAEVQNDPLLMSGRTIYYQRCAGCHGMDGTGDGPTASNFSERVGDLTDGKWEHGDQPEDVIRVIVHGVPESRMLPWGHVLDDSETKAVAAYCYYLSKLPIPDEFRSSQPIVVEEP